MDGQDQDQTQQTDAVSQGIDEAEIKTDVDNKPETDALQEKAPAKDKSANQLEDKTASEGGEHFINQEAVNKRINEITLEKYKEKSKREKLEQDIQQLKSRYEKTDEPDVVIPDMPDLYDDDYDAKVKAREVALFKSAELKVKKQIKEQQAQEALTERLKAQQVELNRKVDAMFSTGKKYGIEEDELRKMDSTVSNFVTDPGLARYILDQKDSALIVKYLASSVQELEKISNMDPMSAAVYVETKIKPKASELKPGLTKTPDPLDIPQGKAAPIDDPYLKGASFE